MPANRSLPTPPPVAAPEMPTSASIAPQPCPSEPFAPQLGGSLAARPIRFSRAGVAGIGLCLGLVSTTTLAGAALAENAALAEVAAVDPVAAAPATVASPAAEPQTQQQLSSEEASLARQLANPVASLISVPFQFNLDGRIGAGEDIRRTSLNIQPVVPFRLNRDWNLISRTILPVVTLQGVPGPEAGEPNFGDTVQSLFLSPARPGAAGVIWGVGPVALLPTATGQLSGIHQWGLGPTGVALVQRGHWTLGALANHLWSVANNGTNAGVNATLVQPFLSYTTTNAWTFSLNSESTYDWAADQWAVPLNLVVSKVTKVGNQLLSVGAGVRYWADGPPSGPHGWGGRLVVTLLFPTR